MSTTTAGILFLAALIVVLVVVHVPLGDYMYRVYSSEKHSRGERVIYRLIGADPKSEQSWSTYARSVLAFSAIGILFLFVLQLIQGKLPLHLNDPATPMTPALAWNTAVSFVTNTNWQAYSGESTQGHLVQMAGLAVQNFVSAAVGMAVAILAISSVILAQEIHLSVGIAAAAPTAAGAMYVACNRYGHCPLRQLVRRPGVSAAAT